MKCEHCGGEIANDSFFCEFCGSQLVSGGNTSNSGNKSGLVWSLIVLIVMCGIIIAVLADKLSNKDRELQDAIYNLNNYSDLYENEKSANQQYSDEISELKQFKDIVSSVYPIIITDIEIGNTYSDGSIETEFGNTLYDYNTMYLKPKIYYTGLASGSQYLKIKWIRPSGDLSVGSSSPYGYSQASSYYLSEGRNEVILGGWGGPNRGHWPSGTYRIEIWYNDICLKAKTFVIQQKK